MFRWLAVLPAESFWSAAQLLQRSWPGSSLEKNRKRSQVFVLLILRGGKTTSRHAQEPYKTAYRSFKRFFLPQNRGGYDPHQFIADPAFYVLLNGFGSQLFTLLPIRIQLLFKVMGICDYWSRELPGLHFESPGLHLWVSTARKTKPPAKLPNHSRKQIR